jgi:hypothetical protein
MWTATVAETRAPGVSWLRLMVGDVETYSGEAGDINAAI